MSLSTFRMYCVKCVACNATTSKHYARAHDGKCKACATGVPKTPSQSGYFVCPDCGERRLTRYQKDHGYHCDTCTREADPAGYIRELTAPQEPPEPYEGGW